MGQAPPTSADAEGSSNRRSAALIVVLASLSAVLVATAVGVGVAVLRPQLAELRAADAEDEAAGATAATAEQDAAASEREVRYMRLRWQAGAAEAEARDFARTHVCAVASGDLEATRVALDALARRDDPVLADQPGWQSALLGPELEDAYQACGSGGTP